jgi:hypothetical protein
MAGLTFLTVEHAHSPVEDCNGHKKMRMDSIARLQRKTPLKQVRSRLEASGTAGLDGTLLTATQQLAGS